MKVLIDMQGLQNDSRYRGIGRYTEAFVKSLIKNNKDHQLFLLFNRLFDKELDAIVADFATLIPSSNILYFNAPGPVDELLEANKWRVRSGEFIRELFIQSLNIDFLLITSLFEGACDNTIGSIGNCYRTYKTAVILYDLIPYLDQEKYIGWEPSRNWYFRKIDALKRADLLLSISDSARNEAITHLSIKPNRVVNISSAVSSNFHEGLQRPANFQNIKDKFKIHKPYIMHTSAFDERKNFHGLIRAFGLLPSKFKQQHQLVLVCKLTTEQTNDLFNYATEHGVSSDSLILTNFVTDEELLDLYRGCYLFVFPSFHEGFGLPPLEAMTCGVATIGSNTSSIPEVIGNPIALFDPNSDKEMSSIIQKALENKKFYNQLKDNAKVQAKKFSWDNSAQVALQALENSYQDKIIFENSPPSIEVLLTQPFRNLIKNFHPTQEELLVSCEAIAKNLRDSEKFNVLHNIPALNWRIEGPFDSSYSLALVNRESARAIKNLGSHVGLFSTEGPGDFEPNLDYLANSTDILAFHEYATAQSQWDVVSRNLFPPRVSGMEGKIKLMHFYAWEETGFVHSWMQDFNTTLQGMILTSTHVAKIMRDNGLEIPYLVTGNGVNHWLNIQSSPLLFPLSSKTFKFLHVSSCFPRKGVDIMLEAYGKAFTKSDDVVLIIKTFKNIHNDIDWQIQQLKENNNNFPDVQLIEEDMADSQLKTLYQSCDVLVAPSKAEGFGLPMAEAMLSDLPVITTAWGGQTDFCNANNAWMVDYEFEYSDTHLDVQPSVWAKPHTSSLVSAMQQAFVSTKEHRTEKAKLGATNLLENFKWTDTISQCIYQINKGKFTPLGDYQPKVAWLSTWNTKCGIATYSEHLLGNIDGLEVQVFSTFEDEGNYVHTEDKSIRSWASSKNLNKLDSLQKSVEEFMADIICIKFNYGFYNFAQLNEFIIKNKKRGRTVLIFMHSTIDPFGGTENWTLNELQQGLSLCDRILVHSVEDMNRLKALKLVDNVTLFPHGILDYPVSVVSQKPPTLPIIASYGFALPHKGLLELIEVVALLKKQNTPVMLKLLNAEHTDPSSKDTINQIAKMIKDIGIEDLVETNHTFMTDEESFATLSDVDLIVYAYQQTGESASGAVRYGIATGKPVAVSPLSIFSDVKNITFELPGIKVNDLAYGINQTLLKIKQDSAEYQQIQKNADNWRKQHSYKALGKRLSGLMRGLYFDKPMQSLYYHGSDSLLNTEVGKVEGSTIVSTATSGYLLYGGYYNLLAGNYEVYMNGEFLIPKDSLANVDIFSAIKGKVFHGQLLTDLIALSNEDNDIISFSFNLDRDIEDLQVRIWVDNLAQVKIKNFRIVKVLN